MKKTNYDSQRDASEQKPIPKIAWLDKHDTLKYLHISDTTLLEWRRKYGLPFHPLGKKLYFDTSDLDKLLKSKKVVIKKPGKNDKKKD